MLKIELFQGEPIICKGISSDPLHSYYFLLQMPGGKIQQVYHSKIKHISVEK